MSDNDAENKLEQLINEKVTYFEESFSGDYASIPDRIRKELISYIMKGTPCNAFLSAILKNDLFHAVGFVDSTTKSCFVELVKWVYTYVPGNAVGTSTEVDSWMASGGLTTSLRSSLS